MGPADFDAVYRRSIDDPEGFWYARAHRGDDLLVCEGSCYETDDGVVHMMLRCEGGLGWLAVSESRDQGETWSEPSVVAGRQRGRVGDAVLTGMGIHIHAGRMAAYYGYYDYDERGVQTHLERGNYPKQELDFRVNYDTHTGIMVSDDEGTTWEGPVAKIDRFVPNLCPQPLSTGRLIMPGNMWYPYTDDPAGVDGWTIAGIPRLPEDHYDDPEADPPRRAWLGSESDFDDESFDRLWDDVARFIADDEGEAA